METFTILRMIAFRSDDSAMAALLQNAKRAALRFRRLNSAFNYFWGVAKLHYSAPNCTQARWLIKFRGRRQQQQERCNKLARRR